jgi:hypothetical protein
LDVKPVSISRRVYGVVSDPDVSLIKETDGKSVGIMDH